MPGSSSIGSFHLDLKGRNAGLHWQESQASGFSREHERSLVVPAEGVTVVLAIPVAGLDLR
jgi:hypothetical protein